MKLMNLIHRLKKLFRRKKLSEFLMDYMDMSIEELQERAQRK